MDGRFKVALDFSRKGFNNNMMMGGRGAVVSAPAAALS